MTFKEAVSYGYLRRRGNYKGAPWVLDADEDYFVCRACGETT